MKRITIAIVLTINVFLISLYSQTNKSIEPVAKEKLICNLDYSINFVKYGIRKPMFSHESDEGVWLKFTNESDKILTVQAPLKEKTRNFMKNIGNELNLYYEVVNKENCNSEDSGIKELPLGYRRVETYFTVKLKPKESIIFSVAKQYFLPNRAIFITYTCDDNCKKEERNKLKKAYFFASELPETASQ